MSKCYVCKSNRRQLLMLTCSHDVCIKCAADNYFLNNVGKRENKKDDKKSKKENYFCQICLEVTKIDQNTVNELKQWYITNVNPKTTSRPKPTTDSNQKQISKSPDPVNEQKPVPRPKQSHKQQQFNPITYEQNPTNQRYKKADRDFQQDRNYRYSNNSNLVPQNEYDQRANYHHQQYGPGQHKGRKDSTVYRMPEEYQTKGLLRYREGGMREERQNNYEAQVRRDEMRNGNPPPKRYSTRANEPTNYHVPQQIPVYERPIQPRYSSRDPSDQYSGGSKQKRVFGSIVKRDEVKNNQNLKEVILRAKDQQRRRINSYKSQEKGQSIYQEPTYQRNDRRMHTETDSIGGSSSARYVLKQHQRPEPINQQRQQIRIDGPRKEAASSKKRQVYLDLIGNQHSLESQQSMYPKQWSQSQSTPDYDHPNPPNQKPHIINKFSNTAQSTYYNTQHTTTPTTTKSPRNPLPNHQPIPNSHTSIPQNRKLYCNIHQDEQIIYYCLECKLLICSECALYGQHKDHNIHTLKKAAFKLKETLYTLVTQLNSYLLVEEQKEQMLMEQIKEIKIESNKEKEKVKFAFENFMKNVQNKYAQVLQQLEQSQTKAFSRFTSQLQKTKQKCTEYFDKKNCMKNLFETFSKNPTNNQLAAPYCQYESTKNTNPSTQNPTQTTNQDRNNRVYRQFDDFFEQNSMTSEQRNFFNTNIQQLQSKISDYEEYVTKLKPQYQKIIYPTFFNREQMSASKRNSVSKTKDFFRQPRKSNRQSQELHESLKFSETSLLIEPSKNSPLKNGDYDDFLSQKDFLEENNLKSLNLMIEKQLQASQLSELKEKLKLANVDTIIESIKEIEDIIKEFRIQYRAYQVKVGDKRG